MKLLRLPYLAQTEILKQMKYEELFLMSFLSKRSMRMIQSVRKKEMTKIDILTLGNLYNFCAGIHKRTIVTLEQESYPTDKSLRTVTSLGYLACSMDYKQQLLPHHPSIVIYSRFPNTDTISTIVYNQLNALFGNYVTFEMSISDSCNVLPTFLKNVTRSMMSFCKAVNVYVLEDYFMNVQEQEYLKIDIEEGLIGKLSENSRLYSIKKLHIKSNDRLLVNDVLFNFKGKELHIKFRSQVENEICQFIARWKSSQELKNFEFMRLTTVWLANIDKIKQKSGFKDLTPELKAFGHGERTFCSSYVVRDDGIVATTLIKQRMALFYVQSFTEEEMLKGTEITL